MIDMYKEGGLKIGVYVRGDGLDDKSTYTGKMEYVLAFEGTQLTSSEDWQNNVEAFMGEHSKHLSDGVAYTGWFVGEKSDYEVTFVGHSKGGGEAAVNAMLYDKNATVFNPSVPMITRYFSESRKNRVKSYVISGEILNKLIGEMPGGNTTYLSKNKKFTFFNHGMESIIKALNKEGYK